MRKLVLALVVLASITFVSCKKATDAASDAVKTTTEKAKEAVKDVKDAVVPKFENEKVGAYIKQYDSYIEEYKKIVESKDMTKFQTLTTKGQELAKKAQALAAEGLSASDQKALNEYMKKKAVELQELAKKMMQ